MDVLILLIFVSFLFVIGGVLLLVFGLAQGDFEHAERLSLLPLADDTTSPTERTPSPSSQGSSRS
ncbi:MAG: cytochrome oxidase [Planctomycetes bacterium]|nr:cytochrome oxidase [Planctomycetota bacterium]